MTLPSTLCRGERPPWIFLRLAKVRPAAPLAGHGLIVLPSIGYTIGFDRSSRGTAMPIVGCERRGRNADLQKSRADRRRAVPFMPIKS
jgi:hypothetical protein